MEDHTPPSEQPGWPTQPGAAPGGPPPDSPPPQQPPPPPAQRELRRSRQDRMIAGVAAGMARHFGIDITLARLAWVAFALMGPGVIAYVVAWIIMPEELAGTEQPPAAPRTDSGNAAAWIVGGVLIAIGAFWLVGPLTAAVFRYILPALLIAVGIAIIANSSRR